MQQKTKAIIVDLDGTLADDTWRRHTYSHPQRNWSEINAMCKYDLPIRWCQELVESMHKTGTHIIFLTARNSEAREATKAWLSHHVPFKDFTLIMRPERDFREDCIVKEDLYNDQVHALYDVLFCLDDKQTVTDMWRRLGLKCLQCDNN